VLLKQDEAKKQEIREIFKHLDVKKKGVVRQEHIVKNHHFLNDLFMIDSEKDKFLDVLQREYHEGKLTEQLFTKLLLSILNK